MITINKALLISNNKEDYTILKNLVSKFRNNHYQLDWDYLSENQLDKLNKNNYEICFIDYNPNNKELIKEIINYNNTIPILLIIEEEKIEINSKIKKNISDFLFKKIITSDLLEKSISYSLEKMKSSKKIELLNSKLEKKVKKRTEVLDDIIENLEIKKSNLESTLEKEKELKTQFVSIASHEFRTPLSTILSSLALMKNYCAMKNHEKFDEHSGKIKYSINNLTELLDDFLSISKLEEGIIKIYPDEFRVNTFVGSICSEMQMIVTTKQQIQYSHIGKEFCYIDTKILKNILYNLISNAIKYSQNEKAIEVKSILEENYLKIIIKDHGIGIPKKDQNHLFDRFFRCENVENIQGTGLGLNIVSNYVNLLNGEINFESEENKGTTFTLTFPQ
jgi:signal transduction histidine kinase